jgi:hypothetical protein
MLRNCLREIIQDFWAVVALTLLCVSLSPECAPAASAHQRWPHKTRAARHHLYATYPRSFASTPASLPRSPEYGFLSHVPANAIRGPGYTFVPGVGILGESCDLPTSACTNEYRDVQ